MGSIAAVAGSAVLPPLAQAAPRSFEPRQTADGRFPANRPPLKDASAYWAPAQGKQGAELLRSVHQIIRHGHVDTGYGQARDGLFQLVADHDRDDVVEDVYTGRQVPAVTGRKVAFDKGLNTEHTWPQSKGARGIAQSDLHQLYPSDIMINQIRGNHPYGEVTRAEWSRAGNQLGVDGTGRTVFEPREQVKGDIARALLYFYARYNSSRPADYTLSNFKVEVPLLVKWANADPVSSEERSRNEDVYGIQGNRNPFIDHPEWVDAIGFDRLDLDRR